MTLINTDKKSVPSVKLVLSIVEVSMSLFSFIVVRRSACQLLVNRTQIILICLIL